MFIIISSSSSFFLHQPPEKFHSNIKSPYYIKPKAQGLDFTVRHFAGKVAYDTNQFLEKNKNFLPTEVIQLFRQSSHDVIRWGDEEIK